MRSNTFLALCRQKLEHNLLSNASRHTLQRMLQLYAKLVQPNEDGKDLTMLTHAQWLSRYEHWVHNARGRHISLSHYRMQMRHL